MTDRLDDDGWTETMNGEESDDDSGRSDSIMARFRALIGKPDRESDFEEDYINGDGRSEQSISQSRREMIERVVAFDDKKVFDVMAPRADIAAVDLDTPLQELIRLFSEAGHSRLPVYRGDLDDPVGMVHIKDLIGMIADDARPLPSSGPILKSLKRDVLYVPPSMRVTDLLLRMQASRIHMALVIDEYGGTDGLVTIEDLVEEIVGEINDEHDEDDTLVIVPIAGGGWEVDARVELSDFTEETGLHLDTEDDEIDTVGGYAVSLAGRVPQRGEVLAGLNGYDFEVIEGDARKVRKLRVRPSTAKSSTQAAE
ncbi:hemolysin family protein [Hyphococcus lacteus]|uniref:Hemolysin family protein n=1 Tax=Hyphococcus lacteus TaxID=3143536 RepID=A0ABV3Z1J4_9PROT